jgi:hypothetical protein
MGIATSCRTQRMHNRYESRKAQYADITDIFQAKNASELYARRSFFTDLGSRYQNKQINFEVFQIRIESEDKYLTAELQKKS